MKLKNTELGYTPKNYRKLIKETGLNNAEFARKFGVKYRTLQANIANYGNSYHVAMSLEKTGW